MHAIQTINVICHFLFIIFPYLALTVLLLITLTMAVKEKRRRKLLLLEPDENQRIDALHHLGELSEVDAGRIKNTMNVLPDVVEEYPLPDIHLRLSAALAKAFSLLKILLIISNGLPLASTLIALLWLPENVNKQFNYHGDKLSVAILSIALTYVIFSAVLQFRASKRILEGDLRSRKILSALWLTDLAFLPIALSGRSNIVLLTIVTVMCGYSLWCLVFRHRAASKINFEACELNKGRYKGRLAALFILCFCCGALWLWDKLEFTHKAAIEAINVKTASSFSISRIGQVSSLNRIAIITATDDQDSATAAKQACELLRKQFPELEFHYLPYGKAFRPGTFKFDQYVFVSKTQLEQPKQKEANLKDIPRELRNIVKKSLLKSSPQAMLASIKMIKPLTFSVTGRERFGIACGYGYRSQPNISSRVYSSLNGDLTVTVDEAGCSRHAALKRVALEISKAFGEQYRKELSCFAQMKWPMNLVPELEDSDLLEKLEPLRKGVKIGSFRNAQFANFSIWLVPLEKDFKQQRKALIAAMRMPGWKYENINNIEELHFRNIKKHEKVAITNLPPKSARFGHGEKTFLIVLYSKPNLSRQYTKADAEQLKKTDFRTYLQVFRSRGLSSSQLAELTEQAIAFPGIRSNELVKLYQEITGNKKYNKQLKTSCERLLVCMGKLLKKESLCSQTAMNIARFIAHLNDAAYSSWAESLPFAPFRLQYKKIKMIPKSADANDGIYCSSWYQMDITKPLIFDLSMPDSSCQTIVFAVRKMENGNNEITIAQKSGMSLTYARPKSEVKDFVSFGLSGSWFSGPAPRLGDNNINSFSTISPFSTKNSSCTILYDYSESTKRFRVKFMISQKETDVKK